MSKQGDAAYAWFLKGYNCSQSVVAAFAPQLGLTEETALRLSAGFGAGIGRMREVCGAFCGVVTVLLPALPMAAPLDDFSWICAPAPTDMALAATKRRVGSQRCRRMVDMTMGVSLWLGLGSLSIYCGAPGSRSRAVRHCP